MTTGNLTTGWDLSSVGAGRLVVIARDYTEAREFIQTVAKPAGLIEHEQILVPIAPVHLNGLWGPGLYYVLLTGWINNPRAHDLLAAVKATGAVRITPTVSRDATT